MKKADAELLVVAELRKKFAGRKIGAMGGLQEYYELLKERPELFEFKSAGDKWQVVQGWINKHKLLK